MVDFSDKIKEIEKFHKKSIENSKKTLKKTLKDIVDNIPKLKDGAKQIESIEQEKLSQGIEAAAKKSKMQFKATKALGELARNLQKELAEDPILINFDEVDQWEFEDFKSWVKGYQKVVNNLDDYRHRANKIMGLDFMLKRRVVETPLNKMTEDRDILRDLLGGNFQIIKAIEDLYRLNGEIGENSGNIVSLNDDFSYNSSEIEKLNHEKDELES
ncbi:MAG: hypothetical protein ACFFD1_05340, partial [Candidatus Thorarchaeota archaeon]